MTTNEKECLWRRSHITHIFRDFFFSSRSPLEWPHLIHTLIKKCGMQTFQLNKEIQENYDYTRNLSFLFCPFRWSSCEPHLLGRPSTFFKIKQLQNINKRHKNSNGSLFNPPNRTWKDVSEESAVFLRCLRKEESLNFVVTPHTKLPRVRCAIAVDVELFLARCHFHLSSGSRLADASSCSQVISPALGVTCTSHCLTACVGHSLWFGLFWKISSECKALFFFC